MTKPDLRLHLEYECYPTWVDLPGGGEDNPDPGDVGVSHGLAAELTAYSDDYDARFDPDDFGKPLFTDGPDEQAFAARGRALAERVAAEVGSRFSVRYRWALGEWEVLS